VTNTCCWHDHSRALLLCIIQILVLAIYHDNVPDTSLHQIGITSTSHFNFSLHQVDVVASPLQLTIDLLGIIVGSQVAALKPGRMWQVNRTHGNWHCLITKPYRQSFCSKLSLSARSSSHRHHGSIATQMWKPLCRPCCKIFYNKELRRCACC
jgi:hypothetical protein